MPKHNKGTSASSPRKTVSLYWHHIRKYKPSFFTMLIAVPMAALLLDVALPYFLAQAIGTFATGDADALSRNLTYGAIAATIGVSLNLLGFQMAIRHESQVRRDLSEDTMRRILEKDYDFFANQKIGALTGKFIDFINGHVGLQDLFILRTLTFLLVLSTGLTILTINAPIVGAIVFGLIVGLLIQIQISFRLRKPLRKARKELVGVINGAAADTITNNLTVKTFAREDYERKSLYELGEKYREVYSRDFRWMSLEGSTRLAVMSTIQIIAVAVMAGLLIDGNIELATAVFAIAYLQRIAAQLFVLGELMFGYDKVLLQAAPMTDILTREVAVKDNANASVLDVSEGKVVFESVSYAYSDAQDIKVLDCLDLEIPAGQKVGLIGHSGAGKTTIVKLLLRFSDVDNGSIVIDGQDIRTVTQTSLRQNIGYVPQEPLLFHRSLRDNIAYGKDGATEAEIIEATKKANAYDFVQKLSGGLDTVVGERGVKLSGGQRQRIAIARAILKDAPILVLDEATSALDSLSEKLIQNSLNELMKNRTSIVIAHRLSTIAKLDRIIVLEGGKIVEDGTHAELLKKKGTYANLWSHQSGGFIEE